MKTLEIDVLVLEDSLERYKCFKKYSGNSVIVDNPNDCLNNIKSSDKVSELWLDHDLGEGSVGDSGLCGMDVVNYLISNKESVSIKSIYIHSMNPYPSQMMFEKLKSAGYNTMLYPFNILKAKIDTLVK